MLLYDLKCVVCVLNREIKVGISPKMYVKKTKHLVRNKIDEQKYVHTYIGLGA
jgi:hypothetical protein